MPSCHRGPVCPMTGESRAACPFNRFQPLFLVQISAIVKLRPSYTCRSVPWSVKNGAPLAIAAVGGGSTEPDFTDVKSCRTAGCDRAPSPPTRAKWHTRASKKRRFAPFSTTFLMIFPGFFSELARRGANWREFGPEKRWFKSIEGFEPRPIARRTQRPRSVMNQLPFLANPGWRTG